MTCTLRIAAMALALFVVPLFAGCPDSSQQATEGVSSESCPPGTEGCPPLETDEATPEAAKALKIVNIAGASVDGSVYRHGKGKKVARSFAVRGGAGPFAWTAEGLPEGLKATEAGDDGGKLRIDGSFAEGGEFPVTIEVRDEASKAQARVAVTFAIADPNAPVEKAICKNGFEVNANGDDCICPSPTRMLDDNGDCVKDPKFCEHGFEYNARDNECYCPRPKTLHQDPKINAGVCTCDPPLVTDDEGRCVVNPGACKKGFEFSIEQKSCVCPAPKTAVFDTCICAPPANMVDASGRCVKNPEFCENGYTYDARKKACACPAPKVVTFGKCICSPPMVMDYGGECISNPCGTTGKLYDHGMGRCVTREQCKAIGKEQLDWKCTCPAGARYYDPAGGRCLTNCTREQANVPPQDAWMVETEIVNSSDPRVRTCIFHYEG